MKSYKSAPKAAIENFGNPVIANNVLKSSMN